MSIPTREEAQAQLVEVEAEVSALETELRALRVEEKALEARLRAVRDRIDQISSPFRSENFLARARKKAAWLNDLATHVQVVHRNPHGRSSTWIVTRVTPKMLFVRDPGTEDERRVPRDAANHYDVDIEATLAACRAAGMEVPG